MLGQTGNFEVIVFGFGMVLLLHAQRPVPLLTRWVPVRKVERKLDLDAAPLPRKPMPPREVVLKAVDVTRKFGGLVANNAMNLEIRAGEILALIGPNGAGKSTMFNQISGVDTPTSGQVTLLGQQVAGAGARRIARLGLSRTFQHVRLLGRMSVLENVAIGAHLRGHRGVMPAAWRLDRAEESRLLAEAARRSNAWAWAGTCMTRPARWRWVSSASWRSRGRWPRIPAFCCWTNRPPGCATRKSASWPSCCASCAPKAWRSCWSSTTWIS